MECLGGVSLYTSPCRLPQFGFPPLAGPEHGAQRGTRCSWCSGIAAVSRPPLTRMLQF